MEISEKIRQYEPFWGTWHIDGFIGAGGFGSVYKIKREEFGETHYSALKHIHIPQDDSETRQLFDDGESENFVREYYKSAVENIYNEIKLMAKLKGTSHIVSYEDHMITENTDKIGYDIFIRMEYLTDLNKYFRQNGVKKSDIIKLGIDLCSGLELCQKYNIIHRDIKPENIYVSPNGDFKLGDFGISRQIEKTQMNLSRKGTPDYMAPEVNKGENYNSTIDIYSVGLVMYRYLNNNRMPFMPPYTEKFTSADKENALLSRLSGKPLPMPQSADGRLAEIVLKACSYNSLERYSSPMLMRMELEKIRYTENETNIIYPAGDDIKLDSTSPNNAKSTQLGQTEYDKTAFISHGEIKKSDSDFTQVMDKPDAVKNKEAIRLDKRKKRFSPVWTVGIVSIFVILAIITLVIFIVPRVIGNKTNLPMISVGGYHTVEVKSDGTLWTWGYNGNGRLGDGTETDRLSPVKIIDDVKFVSAGIYHTAAIKNDGSLWVWGHNGNGKIGDGTETDRLSPVKIMDDVKFVSAGIYHTAAIKNDGSLWTWGHNGNGKLGDGTETNSFTPIKIMDGITAVSTGAYHTSVIKEDGGLWTWGNNGNGQLGDGTFTDSFTPVKIMDDVKQTDTGYYHTVALKNDGSLWVWGYNEHGEIGDGTVTNSSTPIKIMDDVKAFEAGKYNTMAIKNDGSLWAWGYNEHGELGIGATENGLIPVKVTDDVKSVSAGVTHAAAIKEDGSIWTWGYNQWGQLGDGTTETSLIPVKISG